MGLLSGRLAPTGGAGAEVRLAAARRRDRPGGGRARAVDGGARAGPLAAARRPAALARRPPPGPPLLGGHRLVPGPPSRLRRGRRAPAGGAGRAPEFRRRALRRGLVA